MRTYRLSRHQSAPTRPRLRSHPLRRRRKPCRRDLIFHFDPLHHSKDSHGTRFSKNSFDFSKSVVFLRRLTKTSSGRARCFFAEHFSVSRLTASLRARHGMSSEEEIFLVEKLLGKKTVEVPLKKNKIQGHS